MNVPCKFFLGHPQTPNLLLDLYASESALFLSYLFTFDIHSFAMASFVSLQTDFHSSVLLGSILSDSNLKHSAAITIRDTQAIAHLQNNFRLVN